MNRSLASASALSLALVAGMMGLLPATAQNAPSAQPASPPSASPFGPPPSPSSFGAPPPAGSFGASPAAGSPFGAPPPNTPQAGSPCNDFVKLREDAQQKAMAVKAASLHKEDRKSMCAAMERFAAAEGAALKFLQDNKTWCGIPQQAIDGAKANHEKTLQFRNLVCSEGPAVRPKPPTLSDAIGTPSVDSGKNTKTGEGTFDTLTGNPLAK
jgi:hypothetical protein